MTDKRQNIKQFKEDQASNDTQNANILAHY